MSSGYIEIYRAKPTRIMRPPVAPGEHLARNIMSSSHHPTNSAPDGEDMVTTRQEVNVYEVNYAQRSSSVPRGVRHLESHVELPNSSKQRITLEQHRSEEGEQNVKVPECLPRPLHKTRSEGAARFLSHAPKFVTILPAQISINTNEKIVIIVEVEAIPAAEFKWDVNGFELKPSKKVTILNEPNRSTLMIQPPVKQGKYSVTASNEKGRSTLQTKVVYLVTEIIEEVHSETIETETTTETGPDIVQSAVTVTSANEAEWEMVDSVDSSPSTTSVKTVREGERTAAAIVEKAELTVPITEAKIQKVEEEKSTMENGVHTTIKVQIKEEETTSTSTVKPTIPVKTSENIPKRPILLSPPTQNVHVAAGEKLVLESRVDSNPPATFRWYVNNFETKAGQLVSIEQPTENISIATFQKPAPGLYKVVASNPLGEVVAVSKVTTELIVEELKERTIVTTTTTTKPTMYTLKRKPSVTARDDLPKPPRFVERLPVSLKTSSEQPIKLRAAVDAVPEATFMWLLNNFELKRSQNIDITRVAENISELSLLKVQPGKYDVFAKNNMGQDSCSCKVIVEYEQPLQSSPPPPPPKFAQSLQEETTYTRGEGVRLEVVALGSPPFSFSWLLDGNELKTDQNSHITVDGNKSVLITKEHIENGSIITVEVSDLHGKNRSHTVMREAIGEEYKKTIIVEKELLKDVPVAKEPVKVESGTMKLVEEERVSVKEELVTKEQPKEAPTFINELQSLHLFEGDTLTRTVRLREDSGASNFGWFANGLLIIPGEQVRIESTTHESTLTIENIGDMTNVELSVMASNQFGSSTSSANLTVAKRPDESFEMVPPNLPEESAPKIVEPLHSASFIDGQPMVLRCRIEAVPSAAVIWSKDDVNVEEWVINKDVVTKILPGGICELLNPEVYPEDSGLYKCTATNPYGTAETAAYINIEGITYRKDREEATTSETVSVAADESTVVPAPPTFVEQLTAETDGAYVLNYVYSDQNGPKFGVFGSTTTTISWWKDNVELIPGKKYEFHRFSDGALILTIYEPQLSDNGIYTCRAESEHGLSHSTCEVVVPSRSTIAEKPETISEPPPEAFDIVEKSTVQVKETIKEDFVATTEITKHEEEYKILVKVADSVASTLVANIFVDAVREAVKRIMEEESEEEEIVVVDAPVFETSIERYVVKENETVTISTVVSGTPTPFIEWYFKDKKLQVTEQINMGYENRVATLILKNVTQAQEGTYYCHATNVHGTTVLASERTHVHQMIVLFPEKASDTIRLTLAKYDKQDESEQIVTNIFAHYKEDQFEETIKLHIPEKASESAQLTAVAVPVVTEKAPTEGLIPEVHRPSEETEVRPVPPPRKHAPSQKEETAVPIVVEKPIEAAVTESKIDQDEESQLVVSKFAETFANTVMNQVQTTLLSSESTLQVTTTPLVKEQVHDEPAASINIEAREDKIGEVSRQTELPTFVSQPLSENIVVQSAISLKEQINEEATTIDARRPSTQFDHTVTVVEPEVIQLGLHLPEPSTPTMKFIDLETILQRPGTSSSANTLISSPSKGSANAEHRIVLLEGASQNFQNAMTLSLKKVRKLPPETTEPSSFAQVEIFKPNETSEAVVKIVDAEKIIPDLLRVAAAASKLKLENVTVSLVKQPNTAHHELVIEYRSDVEDAAEFNLSQIIYSHPEENVEILATVNSPVEEKVENKRTPSPDFTEFSESATESSYATGQQQPKFFRTLTDCSAVVGKTVQFKCIVSGMPTPEVKWYVDGDVIQHSHEYDIVYEDGVCILKINEVLAEDEGEYTCEASNSVGKVETKRFDIEWTSSNDISQVQITK
ncbi:immunoglobulin I-set domain protein [Necator americanus]|uniref:Immunoglobulin I-set domain protein n=1 Tax=Necator americanus TaxID=51031 RepID=W2T573_NECAM|nr:immunoglobulin I-set domain protein [Necator americanus]ETN77063.1 immunoglobulin I-set domain protein [Necator americanus]